MRWTGPGGSITPPMREQTPARAEGASALLIVALAALLPYLLLPQKPLIIDAQRAIVRNTVVQTGTIGEMFTTDFWGVPAGADYATNSYRPLVTLSYAAQARLLGNSPAPFRLVDMLLHAGTSVLVALLLMQLLPGTRWAIPLAALYAVHPVLSEAVACAVGRADLMAGAALLGALVLHGRAGRARAPWTPWHVEGAALALLGVALLSKEYAVAFPAIFVVVDVARGLAGHLTADDRTRAVRFGALAFVLLGGYLALRYALFGALGGVPMLGEGDHPLFGKPLVTRLATAAWLLVPATRLIALPTGLNYFYGQGTLPIAENLLDLHALAGIALAGVAIALAVRVLLRRRDPVPGIAAALFFVPLAPSLNTVSLAGVLFAERFLYLPTAGAILAIAWALERFAGEGPRRKTALVAVVIVAVVFCGLTMARVSEWTSVESLALSSLRHYPQAPNVIFELGLAQLAQGRLPEAEATFKRSLDLQDNRPQVWKSFAEALAGQDKHKEAAEAWRRVLAMSPQDLAPLWEGYGYSLLRANQYEEAVRALGRAHELMPKHPETPVLLSNALLHLARQRLATGKPGEAVTFAVRATEVTDLPPDGLMLAGLVVQRAGEPDRARVIFSAAIRKDPGILAKRFKAAVALDGKGEYDKAADMFREILAAKPEDVPTLFNLGRSLLNAGRAAEAIPYFEAGLDLRPDPRARAMLDEARRRVVQQRAP